MARPDRLGLDRKARAGLVSIISAKSCSSYVEIRMIRGGHPRLLVEPQHQVEAVLLTQIDVDQHKIRPELPQAKQGLGRGRRDANDGDAVRFQQQAGGLLEVIAVVDD